MKSCWRYFRVADLTALLAVLMVAPAAAAMFWTLGEQRQPVPAAARLAADVKDPVFALLAGLLDDGVFGELDPAFVDSVVTAHGTTKLPHRSMRRLTRIPAEQHSTLTLQVEEEFKVPVPYSILGYNPGSLSTSPDLELWQWGLGDHPYWTTDGEGQRQRVLLLDAQLFGLSAGSVRMDVDWWLDKLLGSRLDDVDLVGFLIFRRDDHRYAVAFGYNPSGRGRTGVFDLTTDEIVFPAPSEYLQIGRDMRAKVEGWMAGR